MSVSETNSKRKIGRGDKNQGNQTHFQGANKTQVAVSIREANSESKICSEDKNQGVIFVRELNSFSGGRTRLK